MANAGTAATPAAGSRRKVRAQALVIPTDEELVIARDTAALTGTAADDGPEPGSPAVSRTVLVVPTGHGVGLTAACLGLVHALDQRGVDVGLPQAAGPAPDGRRARAVDRPGAARRPACSHRSRSPRRWSSSTSVSVPSGS